MYLKDFDETFQEELRDPDFVSSYLQTALDVETPSPRPSDAPLPILGEGREDAIRAR